MSGAFVAGMLVGAALGISTVAALRWAIDFGGDMLVEWTRKGSRWL